MILTFSQSVLFCNIVLPTPCALCIPMRFKLNFWKMRRSSKSSSWIRGIGAETLGAQCTLIWPLIPGFAYKLSRYLPVWFNFTWSLPGGVVQVEKDSAGVPRKRNEPPKQPSAKLVKDKPEKILGVTRVQAELHFLVKYKNKAGHTMTPSHLQLAGCFKLLWSLVTKFLSLDNY